MMQRSSQLIANCTECGTGWTLDDDQPTCPGCGATSYTCAAEDVWAYNLQREWFEQAEAAGSWDV